MNPKGFSFEMDHLRTRSHGRYLTPLPWTSAGIRVWIFCRRLGENSRRRYSTVTEFFLFFFYFVAPASDQFTQFLTRFGFYGTDSLISRCLPNRTAGRSVLFRRRGQRMAARPQ